MSTMASALTALLLASSAVTASPVQKVQRRSEPSAFSVTGFYDAGTPHSVTANVGFSVYDPATNTSTDCRASSSSSPQIATYVPYAQNCTDTSFKFGLGTGVGEGYYLFLTHYIGANTSNAGAYFLGDNEQLIVDQANPNGNVYSLVTPGDFDVVYNTATSS